MAIGIVAEYNPFHNGHKYQLEQAKKLSGDDTAVVVMSGSFVQRGEPALCSKWARAQMAVSCGANLVVELPVCFAVRSAEFFARGAVSLLNALNVDRVAFGCETSDVDRLKTAARILKSGDADRLAKLKAAIDEGLSYPAAVTKAYPEYADILSKPNNLLALEYIKAGAANPMPIQRIGIDHDGGCSGEYASASYIRANPDKASDYMPYESYKILENEIKNGGCPPDPMRLSDIALAKLRGETAESLSKVCDVAEGIENRIIKFAKESASLEELYDKVKTKRFTHARIRRIVISSLLGITEDLKNSTPDYIRVLGADKKGFELLKKAGLPVITKTAGFHNRIFGLEVHATDLYSLLFADKNVRRGGKDFTTSPFIKTE